MSDSSGMICSLLLRYRLNEQFFCVPLSNGELVCHDNSFYQYNGVGWYSFIGEWASKVTYPKAARMNKVKNMCNFENVIICRTVYDPQEIVICENGKSYSPVYKAVDQSSRTHPKNTDSETRETDSTESEKILSR